MTVQEIADKIEEDVLVELGMLILKLDELRSDVFYSCLIEYISGNKSVFKMIFSPNGTNRLRDKFSKLMEGLFRKLISEQTDCDITDEKISFYSCYRTHGCIAIVEKWVLNDLKESSEFMVKVLSDLDQNTKDLMMKK